MIIIPTAFPSTHKEIQEHLAIACDFIDSHPEIANEPMFQSWLDIYFKVMAMEGEAQQIGLVVMSCTFNNIIAIAKRSN